MSNKKDKNNSEWKSVFKWLSIWVLFLVIALGVFTTFGIGHSLTAFAVSAFVFVFFMAIEARNGARPTPITIANMLVSIFLLVYGIMLLPSNEALELINNSKEPMTLLDVLTQWLKN